MPPARAALIGGALALLVALPPRTLAAQQRMTPRFLVTTAQVRIDRDVGESTLPRPVVTLDPENRSLVVLLGALVGASVGALLYRNAVAATNDGDFAAPLSIMISIGGGAVIGGALAWLLTSPGGQRVASRGHATSSLARPKIAAGPRVVFDTEAETRPTRLKGSVRHHQSSNTR